MGGSPAPLSKSGQKTDNVSALVSKPNVNNLPRTKQVWCIGSERMGENETESFSMSSLGVEVAEESTDGIFSNTTTGRPIQPGLGQLFTGNSWSFGGFGFWLLIMFGPLILCFIISYVVHLVHVMKLVRLRQKGLDDDFEGKTYSRASAMLSMRGLERQNTTFLHVRPEDEIEDQSKHI